MLEEYIIVGEMLIFFQGENMLVYYVCLKNVDGLLLIVIVVQEIFGVYEYICDFCCCLVQEGYLVIVFELYFCQGDLNEYYDILILFKELVSKVLDVQVLVDFDYVVSWVVCYGGDVYCLLIIGFCWGGCIIWLYVVYNLQFKVVVVWYGKLVGEKLLNLLKYLVDIVVDFNVLVFGLYGVKDVSILQDIVEIMCQVLWVVNVMVEIVVYFEVDYVFNVDYCVSYYEELVKDGWQWMFVWFVQYGGKKG